MAEEKVEEQETSKEPVWEEGAPKESQDAESPEDQIAKLKETNQGLYERLKKKEASEAELKTKLEEPAQEKPPETKEETSFESLVEFQKVTKDLSVDELEEMQSQAKTLSVETLTFMGSEVGKSYLKSFREKKALEQSVPSPSQKSEAGKTEKKAEEMTPDERADKFEELILKKKSSGV